MEIKAAIFDMDGTLIDSEQYWMQLPRIMLEHFGVTMTDEEYALIVGVDIEHDLQLKKALEVVKEK